MTIVAIVTVRKASTSAAAANLGINLTASKKSKNASKAGVVSYATLSRHCTGKGKSTGHAKP